MIIAKDFLFCRLTINIINNQVNSKMDYNFHEIEKKWQKFWEDNKTFKTSEDLTNPSKCYILDMFPYPSGGLHVGHPEGYTATDIFSVDTNG